VYKYTVPILEKNDRFAPGLQQSSLFCPLSSRTEAGSRQLLLFRPNHNYNHNSGPSHNHHQNANQQRLYGRIRPLIFADF